MNSTLESVKPLLGDVLNSLNDGVYMLDRDMRVVFWNQAASLITGCTQRDMLGTHCSESLNHCTSNGTVLCHDQCPMRQAMDSGGQIETVVHVQHHDGHRVPLAIRTFPARNCDGQIVGAVQVFSESAVQTAALRRIQELEQLATRDVLTGIHNRRFMQEQLELRLEEALRTGTCVGCIFMDVDNFKAINDQYGHAGGDAVLKVIARTLAAHVEPMDAVGRWGGDEFIILRLDARMPALEETARNLAAQVGKSSLKLQGREIPLQVSVGVTQAAPGESAEGLMQRVDRLMYQSKHSERALAG